MDTTPRPGMIVSSGNFILLKPITDLNKLGEMMDCQESIFLRHKMYPVAFIQNWQLRMILNAIKQGLIWETIDLRNK